MSNTQNVSRTVVLGIALDHANAQLVRQRAKANDRSVSAELRRQLTRAGYLTPSTTNNAPDNGQPDDPRL